MAIIGLNETYLLLHALGLGLGLWVGLRLGGKFEEEGPIKHMMQLCWKLHKIPKIMILQIYDHKNE